MGRGSNAGRKRGEERQSGSGRLSQAEGGERVDEEHKVKDRGGDSEPGITDSYLFVVLALVEKARRRGQGAVNVVQ
jgi:hypothetical protein